MCKTVLWRNKGTMEYLGLFHVTTENISTVNNKFCFFVSFVSWLTAIQTDQYFTPKIPDE